ncbi:MAG: HEPN domain-containing protein [Nitrososphaerota archaeon]
MARRFKDLIEDAEDFFGAAQDLFKTKRWSKVCFNAQQSVELALKAALNFYGIEKKGHSLIDLLDELISINKDFEIFRDIVRILDQYYIPTRYANAFASGPAKRHFTESQAKQAIEFAESILKEVKKIVSKE